MKKTAFFLLTALVLAGCSTPPKPKVPDESNRQPVNKTVPIQVQGAVK